MKKPSTKSSGKFGVVTERSAKYEAAAVREEPPVSHDVDEVAPKGAASAVAPVIIYDRDDIAEANRMGAAICRQHAR